MDKQRCSNVDSTLFQRLGGESTVNRRCFIVVCLVDTFEKLLTFFTRHHENMPIKF